MSGNPGKLIIIGAGGAGIEALWVARRINATGCSPQWTIVGLVDDNPQMNGQEFDGVPVLGNASRVLEELRGQPIWFHCGIGRNLIRRKLATMAEAAGLQAATLIDPTAVIAASAAVGAGSYVAPHVFVGPQAQIGRHVLINVGASVGHHAVVGDYAQLCPGARLSGKAVLGVAAFVGSNAVLAPGVIVGDAATVGALSFAARDVPAGVTALGVPAKMLATPPSPK